MATMVMTMTIMIIVAFLLVLLLLRHYYYVAMGSQCKWTIGVAKPWGHFLSGLEERI